MKYLLPFLVLLGVCACGRTESFDIAEFSPAGGAGLEMENGKVSVTASGTDAGIVLDGHWDLSSYKAIRFTVTNEDRVHPIQVYAQVIDSTCRSKKFTRVLTRGKADFHAALMPGETRTYSMDLPRPVPNPEVNRIFRDNFIGPRVRNTPYSYGYGQFSYEVDLTDVVSIGIGATILDEGVRFSVSDVKLVRGEKKELPGWMYYGKEEFFPFIDRYGQVKHAEWEGKVHCDEDLQEARAKEEKDLAEHPGPQEWDRYGGWMNARGMRPQAISMSGRSTGNGG